MKPVRHGPEWFAPKRYGLGAGLPIAWQGWALLSGYLALLGAAVAAFHDRLPALFAAVVPLTIVLLIIAARTTRGGWRWRWGEVEEDPSRRRRGRRGG